MTEIEKRIETVENGRSVEFGKRGQSERGLTAVYENLRRFRNPNSMEAVSLIRSTE